jgi:ketosteroid isomerase-like protein
MVFPAGENPIVGREAIYNDLKEGEHEYTIDWEPQDAEVAKSGEMGWIWGTWTLYAFAGDKNIKILHGKYLDVWKKQEDGSWKLFLDMGNTSPAPDEE